MILRINTRLDGLNDYIDACRKNPHAGANMKAANEQIVMFEISRQLRGCHIRKPVIMRYQWYEKNRRRDLDNISSFGRKVIQDALVKCKVLQNDGWREIRGFSDEFYIDKENPHVVVEIMEVTR